MAIVLKPEDVAQLVFFVRGEKVMFDADLAKLYGVSTKALNQAMSRNKARFPEDFAFQLSREEFENLRSQIVTTPSGRAHLRSQIVTSVRMADVSCSCLRASTLATAIYLTPKSASTISSKTFWLRRSWMC